MYRISFIEFIPQKSFKDCYFSKILRFDFYIPKLNLCIEYNGKQHYYSSSKFGGDNEFELIKKRDEVKVKYCNENNIKLLIIKWNEDILSILKIYFNII